MNKNKSRKIAYLGLLTAVALVFSYVEILIPINFGIPGIKLGAANIAAIMTLYLIGSKESIFVQILRIIVASFLFTNMYSLLYSLAGGLLSIVIMTALKKTDRFSVIGVSIAGGVIHNIGQLTVAMFVVNQLKLSFYGPVLILSGVICGLMIGLICVPSIKVLKHMFENDNI